MAYTFPLDADEKVQAKALRRLGSERIGWLGSVGRDGYPHAVPVWFLWHEDAVLVFSQPHAAKVRNLAADPKALFHLEAGDDGEQFTVIRGTAVLQAEPTAAWWPRVEEPYLAKYAQGLADLKMSAETFAAEYSTVIVVTPETLLAW